MAEKHPDELELLSYVEEELPADDRHAVAEHLVACRSCAENVKRLEAGRAALRGAPLLELTQERRKVIIASLPERRDPWRLLRPARRALVIAAPAAAAAVLVLVFVLAGAPFGGSGDDEESAAVADEAAGDSEDDGALEMESATQGAEDRAETETGAPATALEGELVRSVRGPAAEVVRLLVGEGIPAVVADGEVVATGDEDEVRAALAGRPDGNVGVYVR